MEDLTWDDVVNGVSDETEVLHDREIGSLMGVSVVRAESNPLLVTSTPIGEHRFFNEYPCEPFIKLDNYERIKLIEQIIEEISENKDFAKCFTDIRKEVESWSDFKINNWK